MLRKYVESSLASTWLLNIAARANDKDLPGWRLHPLKGVLAGFWSVTVNANWRIIFRFEKDDVTELDYVDYH
jgi:proteic killer suppression protein